MENEAKSGTETDVVRKLVEAVFAAPPTLQDKALRVLRGESIEPVKEVKPEPFITLRACGAALGLSACSLWRWNVPGHELGGRRKFRISEVIAYIESDKFRAHAKRLRKRQIARTSNQS